MLYGHTFRLVAAERSPRQGGGPEARRFDLSACVHAQTEPCVLLPQADAFPSCPFQPLVGGLFSGGPERDGTRGKLWRSPPHLPAFDRRCDTETQSLREFQDHCVRAPCVPILETPSVVQPSSRSGPQPTPQRAGNLQLCILGWLRYHGGLEATK